MTVRRAHKATLSVVAGIFIVSSGIAGTALAQAYRYQLASAVSPCAHRPAAAAGVVSRVTTKPSTPAQRAGNGAALLGTGASLAATPTPTPTPTATPTPTSTATPTPTLPATSNPDPSGSPAASRSPSPSASPTPTPTRSPKPTPTPTLKPKTAQLCVLVQPFTNTHVHPGGTVSYKISVWSTVAQAQHVTVAVAIRGVAHVDAPRFTVCPTSSANVCTVGTLPTGQSEELVAAAAVRRAATAGERIKLTATVQATRAKSFRSSATVDVVALPAPPTTPAASLPAGTLPTGVLPPLPGGPLTPLNNDPSGLFPTVSPTDPTSPSNAVAGSAKKALNRSNTREVSATLPLSIRLIGGQLIGLAVLATAIAIAIARLSLRGPRPHDGGDAAKAK